MSIVGESSGNAIIVETVSKGRSSIHPTTAFQIDTQSYEEKYGKKAVSRNHNASFSNDVEHSGNLMRPTAGNTIPSSSTVVNPEVSQTSENATDLPEGVGAASAEFTGDMTPGERWVAEAQGQGDSALHPISEAAQQNLAEQQGRAPQEMPKVDLFGKLTSKTANTIQNSGVTPQQMSDAI